MQAHTRPARGFTPLALSVGFSIKEILSLRLGRSSVGFSYGAAGDGDDRQGNGACRGDAAGLLLSRRIGVGGPVAREPSARLSCQLVRGFDVKLLGRTKGMEMMSKIVDNAPSVAIKAAFHEVIHRKGMGDHARKIIWCTLKAFQSAPDWTLSRDELVAKCGTGFYSIFGWVSKHVAIRLGESEPHPKNNPGLANWKMINGKPIFTLKESVAKALL